MAGSVTGSMQVVGCLIMTDVKIIPKRGLTLRGENEMIGSTANGNCLGMLEHVAECADFLKQHIQNHTNLGSDHSNYLSSTSCEERVQLAGKRVLGEIISRIRHTRYYLITLDSTIDESHVDQ